jgi:sialic acid synthase SpsE
MAEGEIVHAADLAIKSPENGAPPYLAEKLIGMEILTAAKKGEGVVA